MRESRRKIIRQGGFSLIGAILLLSIGGMLMTWMANRSMEQMRITQGEIIGKEMARLNNAVLDFSRRYHYEIKEAVAGNAELTLPKKLNISFTPFAKGIANKHLTITDDQTPVTIDGRSRLATDIEQMLRSIHANGISDQPPVQGARYKIKFDVGNASRADRICQPGDLSACYIDSIVYIDRPLTATGNKPDYPKLNAALRQMGPGAGFSLERSADSIRFSPAFSDQPAVVANPVRDRNRRSLPGVLLMHNTRSVEHLPYVRLDGKDPMKGNLIMGGNAITMAMSEVKSPSAQTEPSESKQAKIHYGSDHKLRIGTPGKEQIVVSTTDRHFEVVDGKFSARDIVATKTLESPSKLKFRGVEVENETCRDRGIAVNREGALMHCKKLPGRGARTVWQIVSSGQPLPESYLQISTADITRSLSGMGTTWRQYILFKAKGQKHPYSETHELAVAGPDWSCNLMLDNEKYDGALTIGFERVPPTNRWVATLRTVWSANAGQHDFLLEIGCNVKAHRNPRSVFNEYERRKRS